MKLFFHIGLYVQLMLKTFSAPQKKRVFYKQLLREIEKLGINSIGIVVLISIFVGAVLTIQTALNLYNPLIPKYYIGLAVRESVILEFSSTMVALVLAGKIGSNIASEIGTMRITEQIDVLEIMGLNSANHLILPKIIATMLFNPLLTTLSIFVGIWGGWLVAIFTNVVTPNDYITGIQFDLKPYFISYTLIKAVVFGFIITSISAYRGFYVRGGALEVGRASTIAVVNSCIVVLLFNLILTQLLLV